VTKYLTLQGLEKIKEELEYLEKTKRKEIAERLRHTASFGDLKENAAYDEAKDAQGFLEGRIRELKGILANVKIIEKKADGKAQIGSLVFLKSESGREKFQIVGPEEADILAGKISHLSPLGQALLGKTKGKKITLETPAGRVQYEILAID